MGGRPEFSTRFFMRVDAGGAFTDLVVSQGGRPLRLRDGVFDGPARRPHETAVAVPVLNRRAGALERYAGTRAGAPGPAGGT